METIICLIRHGQTDWNSKSLIQGTRDNPLNDTGREQAKQTANILKDFNIKYDVLMSSPLMRAYETMEVIKKELGYKQEIVTLDELKEREFGELEGKKVCAESYRLMATNEVKGLESLSDLQIRSINALKRIANTYPNKKVLVTTHSQVIKGALSYLLPEFDFKYIIKNSSLNFFKVVDGTVIPLSYDVMEYNDNVTTK